MKYNKYGGKSHETIADPSSGTVTETKTETRYPKSQSILMCHGFLIILMNMMFGLLPTSLFGDRLKYLRCSVSQAYAVAFAFCMIILSLLFVPVTVHNDLVQEGLSTTSFTVMVIIKVTHVCGFLLLLCRGYMVARKMPGIWNQLGQLMQISIVDLHHGKKYKGLKKLSRYVNVVTGVYLLSMIANQIDIFHGELPEIVPCFVKFCNLHLLEGFAERGLSPWNRYAIIIGYVIWRICAYSHILVSVIVGYMVVVVTVCIKAANDNLISLFDTQKLIQRKKQKLKKVKDDRKIELPDGIEIISTETSSISSIKETSDDKHLSALNLTKDISVVAESVMFTISKYFGVSLIIEVLILIANLLVNVYYILVPISVQDDSGGNATDVQMLKNMRNWDYYGVKIRSLNETDVPEEGADYSPTLQGRGLEQSLSLLAEAFIHSYFFYKMCCISTHLANEARETLQILKSIPYKSHSRVVQRQLQHLKTDLASTEICLSATNYFKINKFTLTSVTGSVTTYIIVLLQFQSQERAANSH